MPKRCKKTEWIRFYKDGVHEARGREVAQKPDCEKEEHAKVNNAEKAAALKERNERNPQVKNHLKKKGADEYGGLHT